MTREEIEALAPDSLTAMLAKMVMGWRIFDSTTFFESDGTMREEWNPTTDRNDLAELVAAVPESIHNPLSTSLMFGVWDGNGRFPLWLLTCDPLIVCRAIAVACCGGEA